MMELSGGSDIGKHSLVGARIAGRYDVEDRLGAGGMGRVYLARDRTTDRRCAVKVLTARRLTSAKAVARFRREARILASLSHPHIVRVLDYGEDDGTGRGPFVVLEHVEGIRLDGWTPEIEPDSAMLSRRVAVLAQVAEALCYAHDKGVVHRDLKPNNVLVIPGAEPVARVIDFGVGRLLDDGAATALTEDSELIGTPAFMSPEQCRCEEAGPAADVYALAATAYVVLAGRPPFVGETHEELILAHGYAEPPALHALPGGEGVPPDLADLLRACLRKRPLDRPDAAAVHQHLTALAEDLARRPGPPRWRPPVTSMPTPAPGGVGDAPLAPDALAARIFEAPPPGGWDEDTPTRLRAALRNQIAHTVIELADRLCATADAPSVLRSGLRELGRLEETLEEVQLREALEAPATPFPSASASAPPGETGAGDLAPRPPCETGASGAALELAARLRAAHRSTLEALLAADRGHVSSAAKRLYGRLDDLVRRYLMAGREAHTP